jgi:hypothetical protein
VDLRVTVPHSRFAQKWYGCIPWFLLAMMDLKAFPEIILEFSMVRTCSSLRDRDMTLELLIAVWFDKPQ